MQHIEIRFEWESFLLDGWKDGEVKFYGSDDEQLPSNYAQQQITKYWTTLRRRFPCVTDVVLSDREVDYVENQRPQS
jgi:hypothetical protein